MATTPEPLSLDQLISIDPLLTDEERMIRDTVRRFVRERYLPRAADLFATIVPEDTYAVASEVHDLLVKTHAADRGKIEEIKALVWEYLFIDRILEVATEAEVRPSPATA